MRVIRALAGSEVKTLKRFLVVRSGRKARIVRKYINLFSLKLLSFKSFEKCLGCLVQEAFNLPAILFYTFWHLLSANIRRFSTTVDIFASDIC